MLFEATNLADDNKTNGGAHARKISIVMSISLRTAAAVRQTAAQSAARIRGTQLRARYENEDEKDSRTPS